MMESRTATSTKQGYGHQQASPPLLTPDTPQMTRTSTWPTLNGYENQPNPRMSTRNLAEYAYVGSNASFGNETSPSKNAQPYNLYYPSPSSTLSSSTASLGPQTSPTTSRNKRLRLTNGDRKKICQIHQDNPKVNHTELARMFGVERSTVSKVIRQREKYLNMDDESCEGGISSSKKAIQIRLVEDKLSKWVQETIESSPFPSDLTLMEKAQQVAKDSGAESAFQPTAVWLETFKERCGVKSAINELIAKQANLGNVPPEYLPISLRDIHEDTASNDMSHHDKNILLSNSHLPGLVARQSQQQLHQLQRQQSQMSMRMHTPRYVSSGDQHEMGPFHSSCSTPSSEISYNSQNSHAFMRHDHHRAPSYQEMLSPQSSYMMHTDSQPKTNSHETINTAMTDFSNFSGQGGNLSTVTRLFQGQPVPRSDEAVQAMDLVAYYLRSQPAGTLSAEESIVLDNLRQKLSLLHSLKRGSQF